MPATAERPRLVPISSLLDEPVPSRRRSPPPYNRLPDTKPITSPASSVPSTPKPVLPPSPPPEPKFKPGPPSGSKASPESQPEPDPRGESGSEAKKKTEANGEEGDGIIDMDTFQQILELDDDEGDFSREMVWAFFTQAESTFQSMDAALKEKNLAELSSLGHFLKGSSAALGVCKVQASCEKMQHYGQLRDEEVGGTLTSKDALERIEKLLKQVKEDYMAAEKWLKNYYDSPSS